jgi:opacity protein-like surface antigen
MKNNKISCMSETLFGFLFLMLFFIEPLKAIDHHSVFSADSYQIEPENRVSKDTSKLTKDLSMLNARKWSLGILGGGSLFFGDADKKQLGWALGPMLKYSISSTFAIRAEYNFAVLNGKRILQTATLYKDNFSFTSKVQDWNLQMVFTLGNLSYLRPVRKSQLYLFVGLGQTNYQSIAKYIDQRIYVGDYYLNNYFGTGNFNSNNGKVVEENHSGRYLSIPFGMGMKFNLNQQFDLGLEYRHTYLRSDDIDVYNTQLWQNRSWDSYAFIRIGLAFKFGSKSIHHIDWINPANEMYNKVAQLKTDHWDCAGKDSDKDHVSDCFDQDNSTPDSCMVYGNGMAVDSDGDGIPDCQDLEPFSPKGAFVDNVTGEAVDSDGDGVPDFEDREIKSSPGAIVDRNGVEIKANNAIDTRNIKFNTIFPDHDKINVTDKITLYQIADKMIMYPDTKIKLIAPSGKNFKYNSEMTTRLMNEMKSYLINIYGISSSRIIMDYTGEGNTTNEIMIQLTD